MVTSLSQKLTAVWSFAGFDSAYLLIDESQKTITLETWVSKGLLQLLPEGGEIHWSFALNDAASFDAFIAAYGPMPADLTASCARALQSHVRRFAAAALSKTQDMPGTPVHSL